MNDLVDNLDEIFISVKGRFVWVSDNELWERLEHWESYDQINDMGILYGDCDCFAMACRKQCRKLGIPSRIVYCKTETGGGHAVLESSGWILYNRS